MPAAEGGELSPGRLDWPAFGLLFLLGAFLRLYRVDRQLILDDEWHALNAVQDHGYAWIFSHLGHADHSIPMALLYEWFSRGAGLDELAMRAPSLLAGMLALAVLPLLWRRWLGRGELLLFTGLLAISPFLVNYGRIARPYALLALLAGASVVLAWRWWQGQPGAQRRLDGAGWFACVVLAAWLNPVSLAVSAAPFLWFAGCAGGSALRRRNLRPARRLAALGLAVAAGTAALLYVPLSTDFASLAVRAGFHAVRPGTFAEAMTLFAGSGHTPAVLAMGACAVLGWFALLRRDREFAWYLLLVAATATLAVALTGAAWIVYGLVLARYLIGLLPVFLALAAIGLADAWRRGAARARLPAAAAGFAAPAFLLALFFAGPLPGLDAGRSQFTHHMWHQFDYRAERNPIRQALAWVEPDPFYAEIARLHPDGDAVIVEAPWYLESNWNPLPLYQSVHHQRVVVGFVGGLCGGKLYGELRPEAEGLRFRQFARLRDVLDGTFPADYLVLRSARPPGARNMDIDPEQCESAARRALGEPWRTSGGALVFRLPDRNPAPPAETQ